MEVKNENMEIELLEYGICDEQYFRIPLSTTFCQARKGKEKDGNVINAEIFPFSSLNHIVTVTVTHHHNFFIQSLQMCKCERQYIILDDNFTAKSRKFCSFNF